MSTIQTQNSSFAGSQGERIQGKRLWLSGLGAMVIATIVNSLIRIIALATLPIPANNLQLRSTPLLVIVFTLVGTLAATVVFALINRSARHPISTFHTTATIALVISFIPDFLILAMPHENLAVTGALIPMHILTYLICVGLLTGVARTK
jgi:Family of unknown function (DUF6069)